MNPVPLSVGMTFMSLRLYSPQFYRTAFVKSAGSKCLSLVPKSSSLKPVERPPSYCLGCLCMLNSSRKVAIFDLSDGAHCR